MRFLIIAVCVLACVLGSQAGPIQPCGMTVNGTKVDVSALFAPSGSYVIKTSNATYEIQVCGNVQTNFPNACKIPSPANWIDTASGKCTPIGDLDTVGWDVTPSTNGIYSTYYHGALNPGGVYHYSARYYIECGTSTSSFSFEHFRPQESQFHFTITTPLVCF
eukprot:TRINITY_DN10610_c0_g1_i1.p1 TRINITY_DN10610_c0_g1~~TRINITY_DN10610_c0_g1_i1.p1  ORF type:complete len:163 (+),score=22.84 TRINITY_DN10610_c0_g1_i1:176-664(+)